MYYSLICLVAFILRAALREDGPQFQLPMPINHPCPTALEWDPNAVGCCSFSALLSFPLCPGILMLLSECGIRRDIRALSNCQYHPLDINLNYNGRQDTDRAALN